MPRAICSLTAAWTSLPTAGTTCDRIWPLIVVSTSLLVFLVNVVLTSLSIVS